MGVHFEIIEVDPSELKPGVWVLFLPVGIAEEVYENVPMTQVQAVRREYDTWYIDTKDGVMVRQPGEKVQVID